MARDLSCARAFGALVASSRPLSWTRTSTCSIPGSHAGRPSDCVTGHCSPHQAGKLPATQPPAFPFRWVTDTTAVWRS